MKKKQKKPRKPAPQPGTIRALIYLGSGLVVRLEGVVEEMSLDSDGLGDAVFGDPGKAYLAGRRTFVIRGHR